MRPVSQSARISDLCDLRVLCELCVSSFLFPDIWSLISDIRIPNRNR
jgi:hypothetical protein